MYTLGAMKVTHLMSHCRTFRDVRTMAWRKMSGLLLAVASTHSTVQAQDFWTDRPPDAVFEELLATGVDQAAPAVQDGKPVLVAVGSAPWDSDDSAAGRLRSVAIAAAKAKKSAAAFLNGIQIQGLTRLTRRTTTTVSDRTTSVESDVTREQVVLNTISGVLHSMTIRKTHVSSDRRRVFVELVSTPERVFEGESCLWFPDLPTAVDELLTNLSTGNILPTGGQIFVVGEDRVPHVAGFASVPLTDGKPTASQRLVAGRKAARHLVTFLRGETVTATDVFSEMLKESRAQTEGVMVDRPPQYQRSIERMVRITATGATPPNNHPGSRVADLQGDLHLLSILAAPMPMEPTDDLRR